MMDFQGHVSFAGILNIMADPNQKIGYQLADRRIPVVEMFKWIIGGVWL